MDTKQIENSRCDIKSSLKTNTNGGLETELFFIVIKNIRIMFIGSYSEDLVSEDIRRQVSIYNEGQYNDERTSL